MFGFLKCKVLATGAELPAISLSLNAVSPRSLCFGGAKLRLQIQVLKYCMETIKIIITTTVHISTIILVIMYLIDCIIMTIIVR